MTGQTPDDKKKVILDACAEYQKMFTNAGVRATNDSRDNYTPGWKFNHWEMKVRKFVCYSTKSDGKYAEIQTTLQHITSCFRNKNIPYFFLIKSW